MLIDLNHHAYLIVGKRDLDLLNIVSGSELVHQRYTLFGIKESRRLIEVASLRSAGGRRIFVLEAGRYTTEAQNALLKLFEEPPAETHFVIFHPRLSDFLPTLLSRIWVINEVSSGVAPPLEKVGREFIDLPPTKRLDQLAPWLEEKNLDWLPFLDGVEASLALVPRNQSPSDFILAGRELARARRLLASRGSAAKLIIEHLALALPIFLRP